MSVNSGGAELMAHPGVAAFIANHMLTNVDIENRATEIAMQLINAAVALRTEFLESLKKERGATRCYQLLWREPDKT